MKAMTAVCVMQSWKCSLDKCLGPIGSINACSRLETEKVGERECIRAFPKGISQDETS